MNFYNNGQGTGVTLRLIIGIVIAVCGVIGYYTHTTVNPTTGEKQHLSMSTDDEIALGLQDAPAMAQQMGGEVDPADPRAAEVKKIGKQIVDRSQAKKSQYTYVYHLLGDTQTVNAFALPGGQIFITLGLYDKLSDEAELAGVLGHETGHVVERHVAQQIEKQKLGQSLVTAVGVATSDRRGGMTEAMAAQMANQVLQLSFSRHDESQADEKGLEYMTDSGFDPRGMIDVMKILQQVSAGGHTPEFMQTHPDPGNRITAIQEWITNHPETAQSLTRGGPLPH